MSEPADDIFKDRETWVTWLHGRLDAGDTQAIDEVGQYLMRVYYEPLLVYFKGSSFRSLGDPCELVHGFFASRLRHPAFLNGWRERERRLRYWMLSSFKLFLLEECKQQRRDDRMKRLPADEEVPGVDGLSPEAALDRDFAIALVDEACRRTRVLLESAGQAEHWRALESRFFEGREHQEFAREIGRSPNQVRGMARRAKEKFARVLRDLLERDGTPPGRVDAEIRALLETIDR